MTSEAVAVREVDIQAILDRLILREDCVLTYDASLVSQLPDILRENHGIAARDQIPLAPDVKRLFETLRPDDPENWVIEELPSLLDASGVKLDRYSVEAPPAATIQTAKEFDHWSEELASHDVNSVLRLQKDLGMGRYSESHKRHDSHLDVGRLRNYLRSVTTAPPTLVERLLRRSFWEIRFALWKLLGIINADQPSLSVGPRWVTEIEFFRRVVGLRRHIGLDLFSDDPELVLVGDMHKMPFPGSHFGLVFLKNVVDKSYDIRTLVEEIIRVVKPGGVVVVDQICGYGACTPLTRTDIQHARNLFRVFRARVRCDSLVCHDVDVSGLGDAKSAGAKRYNARLAVRLWPA